MTQVDGEQYVEPVVLLLVRLLICALNGDILTACDVCSSVALRYVRCGLESSVAFPTVVPNMQV